MTSWILAGISVVVVVAALLILRSDVANDPRRARRSLPEAVIPLLGLVGLLIAVWRSI